MCGRYTVTAGADELVESFAVPPLDFEHRPRFNVAPTQDAPVVVLGPGGRRMGLLRWGLVPFWAEDPSIGNRMINARSEGIAERPAFREAFARRRCLVVADGFYEWRRMDDGSKAPYWVHRPDRAPFALGGIWERWRPREGGEPLVTFAVVTTAANRRLAPIHDRLPVVVPTGAWDAWMDRATPAPDLEALMRPPDDDLLTAWEVSTRVNRPENDDASCVEPVEEAAP